MFSELPEKIKQEVLYYLRVNNFPKAKQVHDSWVNSNFAEDSKKANENNMLDSGDLFAEIA